MVVAVRGSSVTIDMRGGTLEQDFEGGAAGWTQSGNCSTGAFVTGTPTQVVSSNVTSRFRAPGMESAAHG